VCGAMYTREVTNYDCPSLKEGYKKMIIMPKDQYSSNEQKQLKGLMSDMVCSVVS